MRTMNVFPHSSSALRNRINRLLSLILISRRKRFTTAWLSARGNVFIFKPTEFDDKDLLIGLAFLIHCL